MSDLLWADVISSSTNDDYFLIQIWQRVVWWSVLEIEKIDMGEGGGGGLNRAKQTSVKKKISSYAGFGSNC
jgi:hypothetical protein